MNLTKLKQTNLGCCYAKEEKRNVQAEALAAANGLNAEDKCT